MRQPLYIFLLTCLFATGQAQTGGKDHRTCQLVYHKDLDMNVYRTVDVPASADEHVMDSIMMSDSFKFRAVSKKYSSNQMVRLAYLIDKDGTPKLLKVFDPKNDKEIEEEAGRIIGLLPIHSPAMCGQEPVQSTAILNIRLYPKDRTSGRSK